MAARKVMSQATSTMFIMNVQRALEELIKNYERCEQMCAAQYGVTVAQSYALLALPREETVTMNDLSQSMGLANSTMTRMVDQLVAKGLAVRDAPSRSRHADWRGPTSPPRARSRWPESRAGPPAGPLPRGPGHLPVAPWPCWLSRRTPAAGCRRQR